MALPARWNYGTAVEPTRVAWWPCEGPSNNISACIVAVGEATAAHNARNTPHSPQIFAAPCFRWPFLVVCLRQRLLWCSVTRPDEASHLAEALAALPVEHAGGRVEVLSRAGERDERRAWYGGCMSASCSAVMPSSQSLRVISDCHPSEGELETNRTYG